MSSIEYKKDGTLRMSAPNAVFNMDVPARGQFTLETGHIKVQSIPAKCGDFSESFALDDRRRPHESEDGQEVSIEANSPIPFGASPEIQREYRMDDNSLSVTATYALRAAFPMLLIDAGGLEISGELKKFAVINVPKTNIPKLNWEKLPAFDAAGENLLYCGTTPPLQFHLADTSGNELEFELGEDIWRWINAEKLHGRSEFRIALKEDGSVAFTWLLHEFRQNKEETLEPPPGRNWRIRYRLLWKKAEKENAKPVRRARARAIFDLKEYEWPKAALSSNGGVCCASAAALKVLKNWVRSQFANAREGDVFVIKGYAPHICSDPVHQERPKLKNLIHWDEPAMAEFLRWANRQLNRFGARIELR